MFIAGACLLAFCGCTRSDATSQQPGTVESPGAGNSATDTTTNPNTGVSNKNETFPVQSNSASAEGSTIGSKGSGAAIDLQPESADVYQALLNLKPIQTDAPEIIIDEDNRTRINPTTSFPERTQVLVVLPGGRCSGTLVGKDLVLTAGHCVHGGRGGSWVTSATVYPGRNGALSPYGSCSAVRLFSVVGWTRDGNSNYDIGAIKLNCDVGQRTGWMGIFWQSASLLNKSARISGYPGDKPLEQWTHKDKVRAETALTTSYKTDTMPGNSGSGVFAEGDAPAGCGGPCVHTVHTRGDAGAKLNRGTRLTQPLFNNIVQWINAPKS